MCILDTICNTHLCMQLITRTNVVWLCSCTISGTLLYPEKKEEIHGRKKWIMPGVMEKEEESTSACISSTAGSGSNTTDMQSSRFSYLLE